MLALLLCCASLDPSAAPLRSLPIPSPSCQGVRVRVPHQDAILQAILADAHALALEAGEETYDEVMEELCSASLSERPAYWARVWPCSIALARTLLGQPALVEGKRVMEVGAGLGVGSVSAAMAGAASVIATDRERDALAFIQRSAADNDVASQVIQTALLDWALPDPMRSLEESLGHTIPAFDVVLCSDCLYDASAPSLLARLLDDSLASDGRCVLTDDVDRPYKSERRDEVLTLLCDERGFVLEARTRATVEYETHQGNLFEIEQCVLRRQPMI